MRAALCADIPWPLLLLLQETLGPSLTGWFERRAAQTIASFDTYLLQHRSCLRPGPAEMTALLQGYLCSKVAAAMEAEGGGGGAAAVKLIDLFPFPQLLSEGERSWVAAHWGLGCPGCYHT